MILPFQDVVQSLQKCPVVLKPHGQCQAFLLEVGESVLPDDSVLWGAGKCAGMLFALPFGLAEHFADIVERVSQARKGNFEIPKNTTLPSSIAGQFQRLIQRSKGIRYGEQFGNLASDIFSVLWDLAQEDMEASSRIFSLLGVVEEPPVHDYSRDLAVLQLRESSGVAGMLSRGQPTRWREKKTGSQRCQTMRFCC